jgi:hypothetical protein
MNSVISFLKSEIYLYLKKLFERQFQFVLNNLCMWYLVLNLEEIIKSSKRFGLCWRESKGDLNLLIFPSQLLSNRAISGLFY